MDELQAMALDICGYCGEQVNRDTLNGERVGQYHDAAKCIEPKQRFHVWLHTNVGFTGYSMSPSDQWRSCMEAYVWWLRNDPTEQEEMRRSK